MQVVVNDDDDDDDDGGNIQRSWNQSERMKFEDTQMAIPKSYYVTLLLLKKLSVTLEKQLWLCDD